MCLCLRVLTEGDALPYVPDMLWMDLYHRTDFRGAVSIRVSEETNPAKFKITGINPPSLSVRFVLHVTCVS